MTNETVTATAAVIQDAGNQFSQQLGRGQDLWNQIVTWIAEKGVAFAVNAVVSVLLLVLGWLTIKLIVAAVRKAVSRNGKRQTLFVNFVCNVVSKVCWAVLIVTVLGRLGVNVGPIVAGLGVTGFILGFAFQESLGNLASGLMIAINEPFKIGDYVIVAGLEGTILEVDMMATVLATADNKKVVVPNKSAWGAPITNFSALGKRRVDLTVGIDYGSDLKKAIELAEAALKSVPGVLAEPAPSVSVAALNDSQVTLNIRPWTSCADYWAVWSDSFRAVKDALAKGGVAIPFPQLTVHMDK